MKKIIIVVAFCLLLVGKVGAQQNFSITSNSAGALQISFESFAGLGNRHSKAHDSGGIACNRKILLRADFADQQKTKRHNYDYFFHFYFPLFLIMNRVWHICLRKSAQSKRARIARAAGKFFISVTRPGEFERRADFDSLLYDFCF